MFNAGHNTQREGKRSGLTNWLFSASLSRDALFPPPSAYYRSATEATPEALVQKSFLVFDCEDLTSLIHARLAWFLFMHKAKKAACTSTRSKRLLVSSRPGSINVSFSNPPCPEISPRIFFLFCFLLHLTGQKKRLLSTIIFSCSV